MSSSELTAELTDVLTRLPVTRYLTLDTAEISQMLAAMAAAIAESLPLETLPVHCRDPKDDKVLACALGASAGFIVSGDEDLLVLDGHPALGTLRIVTPRQFLDILGTESEERPD